MNLSPCVRHRFESFSVENWKKKLRMDTSGRDEVSRRVAPPETAFCISTTSDSATPELLASENPIRSGRTNGGTWSVASPTLTAASMSFEPTWMSPWKPNVTSGPVGVIFTPSSSATWLIVSQDWPNAWCHPPFVWRTPANSIPGSAGLL